MGPIEETPKRKRARSLVKYPDPQPLDTSPEGLKARLAELAYQDQNVNAAKDATVKLFDRVAPRQQQEEQLSAAEALLIANIYERIFGPCEAERGVPDSKDTRHFDSYRDKDNHLHQCYCSQCCLMRHAEALALIPNTAEVSN